jgi:hypothetical protein
MSPHALRYQSQFNSQHIVDPLGTDHAARFRPLDDDDAGIHLIGIEHDEAAPHLTHESVVTLDQSLLLIWAAITATFWSIFPHSTNLSSSPLSFWPDMQTS